MNFSLLKNEIVNLIPVWWSFCSTMSKVSFSAVFDDDSTNNMAPCQSYGHLKTCLFQQFYFSAAHHNEKWRKRGFKKATAKLFFSFWFHFRSAKDVFLFWRAVLPSTCKKKFLRPKNFSFTVTHLKIKLKTNHTSLT